MIRCKKCGNSLSRDKIFLMSNYAIVSGEEGEEEHETTGAEKGSDYNEQREKYIEKEVVFCQKQLKNLKIISTAVYS